MLFIFVSAFPLVCLPPYLTLGPCLSFHRERHGKGHGVRKEEKLIYLSSLLLLGLYVVWDILGWRYNENSMLWKRYNGMKMTG